MTKATQLIITADDFGNHLAINAAVEQAYSEGVLSAASLMMGGEAVLDAVDRARRLPGLAVGLHITLVHGRPVLPPEEVSALVTADGRFHTNLAWAGVKWFFSPVARRQLRAEIAAQFAAFAQTRLTCDHVNAHNHMHVHPTVLSMIMREARRHGVHWVRLPYEPGVLPLLRPLLMMIRWRLRRNGFRCNDQILGLRQSGHFTRRHMLTALEKLPEGVVELYCHPATEALPDHLPGYDPPGELAALCADAIRSQLAHKKIVPTGFEGISRSPPLQAHP